MTTTTLASELECDLQDTVDWDNERFGDFNAAKKRNCFRLDDLITLDLLM